VKHPRRQHGSALFVSLLMLALLTILGTATVSGRMVELRIAGNTQRMMESFQQADSGLIAAVSLVDDADSPLKGRDDDTPFDSFAVDSDGDGAPDSYSAAYPLTNIPDVVVASRLIRGDSACNRDANASSSNTIQCEFYDIRSTHTAPLTGATTTVHMGIRRQIIAQ